jgi:tellurium resistance protein TerD
MAINLEKGGRINLSKEAPSLKRVRLGLGWEANSFDTGHPYDLDVSMFVCKMGADGNAKLIGDEFFVFYNNTTTPDGAVIHSGDSRKGESAGDDETLTVELAKLNPEAAELSVVVTIHDADGRKQNFGQVRNSYVKLYDDETGAVLAQYNLEDDFSTETAVQFGSLYKKDGQWLFKAVGAGYKRGLADFVSAYGGSV